MKRFTNFFIFFFLISFKNFHAILIILTRLVLGVPSPFWLGVGSDASSGKGSGAGSGAGTHNLVLEFCLLLEIFCF